VAVRDFRTLAQRLEVSFAGRSLQRFVALQGLDRAVVLASQTFTALIPLLLLVSAWAPAGRRDVVAIAIIRRFELDGESADAVNQLFAHPGDGTTGVLSVFLLLFSGLSLARRLQRTYRHAWGVEGPAGARGALGAVLGLAVLVLGVVLLYTARTLVGSALVTPVAVVTSFLVWVSVPWLLMDRRIAWRRLIPGGALTAACSSIYGVASTIYMPPLFETYSRRYGLFGVTLALIGWLLCIALIVVASTAVAAELDRTEDPWARGIRSRLRLAPDEPAHEADAVPPGAGVLSPRRGGSAEAPGS